MTDATHDHGLRIVDGDTVRVSDCPRCGVELVWEDSWTNFDEADDPAPIVLSAVDDHPCNADILIPLDDWTVVYR